MELIAREKEMKKGLKGTTSRELIRSSIWTYTGTFITLFLALISTVIFARLLDKENWGILSTVIAVVSFLSAISEIGLNYYILYTSSKFDRNISKLKEALSTPLKFKFAIIFLISLLMAIFSQSLADWFSIKDGSRYFLVGAIYFILYNLFCVFSIILDGIKKFKEESIFSVSNQFIRLVVSSILIILGFGVDGALLGFIFALLVNILIQIYILRNVFSISGKGEDSIYDMFSLSFFYGITSIAAAFTMWSDSVMIGIFIGTTAVGMYKIAVSIASASSSLINAISKVAFPYFTSDEASGISAIDRFNRVIRYVLFLSVPAAFGIFLLSDSIIQNIFGLQYAEASLPLMVLSYFIIDGTLTGLLSSYLGARKLTRQIGLSTTIGAFVNIILNLVFIPFLGILGAAISSILSRLTGLLIMLKWSEATLRIKFSFPLKIPLIGSLVMSLILIFLRLFFNPSESIFHLISFVLIGVIVYSSVVYLLGFELFSFARKVFLALLPGQELKINSLFDLLDRYTLNR